MAPDDFFHDEQSRLDRYEKHRKNTRNINRLIMLGVFLAVLLIFLMVYDQEEPATSGTDLNNTGDSSVQNDAGPSDDSKQGETKGPDNDQNENETQGPSQNKDESAAEEQQSGRSEENMDEPISGEENTGEDVPSDENVIDTIVKDWDPIGTEQEEPHVTTYDENSQDWKELLAAIRYAVGLQQDNMITWWVENGGGPEKVIATVTNRQQDEIYRVYLQWVTEEGWMPTKVEILKENDQKYRFES
ncbi:MAG: DUF1510 family protein [Bacillaceae bacterium]|nr:DUF1510 family protein [Bacillaceae bacterium]